MNREAFACYCAGLHLCHHCSYSWMEGRGGLFGWLVSYVIGDMERLLLLLILVVVVDEE